MINRAALLLKYKQPMIDWINSTDSSDNSIVTLEEMTNEERTVYLIDENSAENLDQMLKKNYDIFFENELNDWYQDESAWPKPRTYKLFMEWFDVECHTVIEDLVGTEIVDEDV